MNQHHRDRRKIDPSRGDRLGDNTENNADRIEIGPTPLAFAEWERAGLTLPDLQAMRRFRWQRLTDHIVARDWAGLLMFDPLNIRYATDSTNMQLWNTHNPFRATLLCADGHMVMWDYRQGMFLSSFNPLVKEVRSGADFFYFDRGDGIEAAVDTFVKDLGEVLSDHAPGNQRIGIDKPMIHALRGIEAAGFTVFPGEECTEKARAVKGPDEILAMRCATHACETAVGAMEDYARAHAGDGQTTENDIWAILHAENIRRGGEWIETRLLSSGQRTNPWFQECGPRVVQPNEILAFDTDLIASYGICIDMSRTWWLGDLPPRPDMLDAMAHAVEHINSNIELIQPGINIEEITRRSHRLRPEFLAQKYGCLMHGVGLCDEWPLVAYPDAMVPGAFDYCLEPGMVLCAEVVVSEVGADFSIRLEEQVLVTETGHERLTTYPYDPALMGG